MSSFHLHPSGSAKSGPPTDPPKPPAPPPPPRWLHTLWLAGLAGTRAEYRAEIGIFRDFARLVRTEVGATDGDRIFGPEAKLLARSVGGEEQAVARTEHLNASGRIPQVLAVQQKATNDDKVCRHVTASDRHRFGGTYHGPLPSRNGGERRLYRCSHGAVN